MSNRPLVVSMMLESGGRGGAENVVFDLAVALRERGNTVYSLGPARGDDWLGEKLRANGFETSTFDLPHMLDFRCLWNLTRLFRRLRVDIVHGHEFDGAVYGAAAAKLAGTAHVCTLHGNHSMSAAWRRRAALRQSFRWSRAVVAVSDATKRQLEDDLGVRPDVIRVIRNGVPVRVGDASAVRAELGVRGDEVVIVAVGSLIPLKGHIYLLRALRRLEEEGLSIPWRLAIAGGGGGEELPRLEAFVSQHGMQDRVHILTNRDDVPDLLAAADVFAMPSLREGLPLAMLEAMQVGVAIIASDIFGIPEAIVHEEHGLLIRPGDVESLAAGLRRLLQEPTLRQRLSTAARSRAMEGYTVDTMADAYERLYRSVCTDRTTR